MTIFAYLGHLHIQIAQGLAAKGSRVEVLHLVEVLDEAYGGPSGAAGLRR